MMVIVKVSARRKNGGEYSPSVATSDERRHADPERESTVSKLYDVR